MRRSLLVVGCVLGGLPLVAQSAAKTGPAAASAKTPVAAFIGHPGEKETYLPVKRVSLYKNGVGFFEQAGKVTGDELVRIDFTTAQLNDVLQSLTAVDLGGGRISGGGYNTDLPLAMQLDAVAPGLGQDPTVMDFLRAIKGSHVVVRTGAGAVSGRVFNVEVRHEVGVKGGEVERRYLAVMTDSGGLKTVELTPSVEVRLTGAQNQEIGKYLQLLATSHAPSLRHLTIEDVGAGERELHVSYISAVPAWKSSYRILLTSKGAETATLQGWAMVDNTSGADWENVELSLVSGAPQSFIQQISRPLDVRRPVVPMPIVGGSPVRPMVMGAMADPIGEDEAETVPMNASSIGGGAGVEVHRSQPQVGTVPALARVKNGDEYESEAEKSLETQTTTVDRDDLFEYKLSKPITIRRGESATVPILQTEVTAKRVTVWNPHPKLGGAGPDRPELALWVTNKSDLTLDRGSFSLMEDGMFGGEGQIDLLHPKERMILPYGLDEAVSVQFAENKKTSPMVRRVVIEDGKLKVHRLYPRVREYTVTNAGTSAKTVVIEAERTDRFQMSPGKPRIASVWDLGPGMPAASEETDKLYRFEVEVGPSATSHFELTEVHSHPVSYEIAAMPLDELEGILKEAKGDAELTAKLQPIVDQKRQLAELGKQIKSTASAMDFVKIEEKRIRENMAALNGGGGEQSLAKRYADEMNAQEDKMEGLQKTREQLQAQHDAVQKQLSETVASLHGELILKV